MAITILDGSIGQELVHRHGAQATPFWSTSVMLERPELVRQLHADYFAAGAEIATTNTYAVLPDRLEGSGFDDRLDELLSMAVEAAISARDAHGGGQVAGAIGPLGASYRTDFTHSVPEAIDLYRNVIPTLASSVDLLLAETVSSLAQVRNTVGALDELASDVPAWIALSVDDADGTRLRSGELLADALPLLDRPWVEATLINCSRPEVIAGALSIIGQGGRPTGAYANGFTGISAAFLQDRPTVDALTARRDLSPTAYADFAETWAEAGATIIGGCCEVGPAHIAELKRRLG